MKKCPYCIDLAVILLLMVLSFSALTFAETTNYYVHKTKVFQIIPPRGFSQVILFEKGVQFIDPRDKSFLNIRFSDASEGYTENRFLEQFKDEAFRQKFIKGLEKSSTKFETKVTDNTIGDVNGIAAWKFTAEAMTKKGLLKNEIIAFTKSNKKFFIILGATNELFDSKAQSFKEALATFEVME